MHSKPDFSCIVLYKEGTVNGIHLPIAQSEERLMRKEIQATILTVVRGVLGNKCAGQHI